VSFIIVADTREQHPYSFPCATNRKALAAGDYSVEGLEDRVAVERKSLADFVHTVIHDHERFGREMLLLSTYDAACVVVEADLDAVLRSQRVHDLRGAKPESVLGACLHITLRYGVPVFWCGSRQAARTFTEMYLRMAVRKEMRNA
jgi:ERCC4-type nuclease